MRGIVVGVLCVLALATAVGAHDGPDPHRLSFIDPAEIVVALTGQVSISASPDVLTVSGQEVTVSFSGVASPATTDWIAVYAPTNDSSEFIKSTPVKYKLASSDSNYMKTGNGSVTFRLLNMRSDYVFAFMRDSLKKPTLAALSNSVAFTDYNVPMQGHLSLTPTANTLAVTWVSRDTANPMVWWGLESGVYVYSNTATTYTYSRHMLCGAPGNATGWRDPGAIHTALLTKLTPGTRYFYVFGDQELSPFEDSKHPAGQGIWSKEFSFVAPPSVGPDSGVHIAAYGDMGTAWIDGSSETGHHEEQPAIKTSANLASEVNSTDIVFHIGDISYARGYATDWEDFHAQIEPIAANLPYMTGIGNHERDFPHSGSKYTGHDSGGECGVPFSHRFPYAGAAGHPGSHKNDTPWYSFDFGNVHAVFMSTEHDFSTSSAQFAFLKKDLASVDRTRTPWLIFTGHRPMYIDSKSGGKLGSHLSVASDLRKYIEPLLVEHNVDLALWGHHHSYQRTCPVQKEVCQSAAEAKTGKRLPVHIVIGMAGMGLSHNLKPTPPAWIEYVTDKVYGYSRIHTNSTTLHFEFVENKGKKVLDHLYLSRA